MSPLNIAIMGGRHLYKFDSKFIYHDYRRRYCEAVKRYIELWGFKYIYLKTISRHVDLNDRPSKAAHKIIDMFLAGELDAELTHLAQQDPEFRNRVEPKREHPPKVKKPPAERRWHREADRRAAEAKLEAQGPMPAAGKIPADEEWHGSNSTRGWRV